MSSVNLKTRKLPSGWQVCSLPDFTHIEMGQSPPSETYNHEKVGLPFFQGKAEFTDLYPEIDKYCSVPNKIAKAGAVLLSVRAPVGPTNLAHVDCCIGRGLAGIHPLGGIDSKFILLLMRSLESDIADKGTGSTFSAINKTFLEELQIALPPLNEQKRIVAKIEELFSELDSGIESLKTAREQLKVYRQAVLKHAFEGKLTAPWREKNKDKLESADQLLARIKRERDAEGKRAGKKKLKEPRPLSDEDFGWLSSVPEGWCWERLGWMTCGIEYGTGAKSSETGEVPVLRMGNIQNMKFDWDDLVYTSDAQEISDYLLHEGDVLFNRTNSPEWVGKTAIYKGERPAVFAGYLMRVNQINSIVDPRFLNFYLNSHTAKQYGNKVKTDGVNQSNINGEKLANYPFPFCSLEEQRIIVDLLEEQMSSIDRTEADTDFHLQKSEALRQSILKKAFSGQLVAKNTADEPASVLLERIRSEKAAPKPTAKKLKEKSKAA